MYRLAPFALCPPGCWGFCFFLTFSQSWAGSELQVEYTVSFENPEDSSLISELRQVSTTVQKKDNPPATKGLLKRRARSDLPRMRDVLKAKGHFDARVQMDMHRPEANKPIQVVFTVHPGPVYRIRDVHIRPKHPDLINQSTLPSPQDLGVPQGAPSKADVIRNGRSALLSSLKAKGHVLATADKPKVLLDTDNTCVDIEYPIAPGPKAKFGPIKIEGLETVHKDYVRSKIPWSQGETYDPQKVRQAKNALIQTELFNLVQVEHADQVNDQGRLPMTLRVTEVDHKRISFRLGYETDRGPLGTAAWEHKNLWGRGRRLLLQLEASQIRQELLSKYTQENLWDRDMDLVLQGSVFYEDIDAYTSTGAKVSAHVEKEVVSNLRLGGGLGYKGSRVQDSQEEQTFHQFSLPAFAAWDTRNDPLDPSQGSRHNLHLRPMFGLFGEQFSLLKSSLGTHWYFDLLPEKKRAILALRGKVGMIDAPSTSEVPADERFYAGGGGSIRGYPYQEVGPYRNGDPYGGRSLLETSAELRWKWSPTIGSVAFVDAGNAFDSSIPDPGKKLYWGAGCGLRYYTGIGPLRLDVAFPLTSNEHIDDSYHLYISLGQSF
ncbi:MAG: autotransporter assembly complex protein TamA [Thermodesulfobacteriota bacterium]